jgi:hypothetical protein
MSEDSDASNNELQYTIVRSSSTGFASATNKLSAWVTMRMEDGWRPHGPPQIVFSGEKWFLAQAMTIS